MRKGFILFSAVFAFCLIVSLSLISAGSYFSVPLKERNVSYWSVMDTQTQGSVTGWQNQQVVWVYKPEWGTSVKTYQKVDSMWLQASNLQPNTNYTLIYNIFDGIGVHGNAVFCLSNSIKTDNRGSLDYSNNGNSWISYIGLGGGGKDHIWLVLSDDLNCTAKYLRAYEHANEYLYGII